MARSLKKGPFINPKLYKKVAASSVGDVIQTYSRSSMIIPDMVGRIIMVHNGRQFFPVKVSENFVGHRLGEFSPTRLFRSHGGDKKVR